MNRNTGTRTLGADEPWDDPPPAYTEFVSQTTNIPQATYSLRPLDHGTSTFSQRYRLPDVTQCLTHLKLLECFNQLREDIGGANGLFGIRNEFISIDLTNQERSALLAKLCEKRWQVYVTRACFRFQSYWRTLERNSKMIVEDYMKTPEYVNVGSRSEPIQITVDNLPPLDILMVYHAFLLNPRNFFADCARHGKMGVWAAGMPWDILASTINGEIADYHPGVEARTLFERQNGHPWDNLDEPDTTTLRCVRCSKNINVPWTTVNNETTWASDRPGEDGTGFADKAFSFHCNCGLDITHEFRRTQKFKEDMRLLFVNRTPMPGTLLTISGLPAATNESTPGDTGYPMTYPNRLIKSALGKKIAKKCSTRSPSQASMQDILDLVLAELKAQSSMNKSTTAKSKPDKPSREEKIAIRRMMSTYWDNSSIFNMDLVGAVIRQSGFVKKMHNIDWLHSLTPESTMQRLISKYERYFIMISRHPGRTVVPTLDIDLAWHTHQTTPPSYYAYSLKMTNTFIDHDDKIDENMLSTSFEWTSKTYQQMFNSVYSECTCWYCEAIRESHMPQNESKPLSRLFKRSRPSPQDQLSDSLAALHASPPVATDKANHISAHGAMRPPYEDPETFLAAVVTNRKLGRKYALACQRAQKAGRPVPQRDETIQAWGHSIAAREDWAPFMADPNVNAGLYVTPPACASAQGSCALANDPGMDGTFSGKGIAMAPCGGDGGCGSDGYGGCGNEESASGGFPGGWGGEFGGGGGGS